MSENLYEIGTIVEHPSMAEWGPGKIVHVEPRIVHVVFRDLAERAAKKLRPDLVPLQVLPTLILLPDLPTRPRPAQALA